MLELILKLQRSSLSELVLFITRNKKLCQKQLEGPSMAFLLLLGTLFLQVSAGLRIPPIPGAGAVLSVATAVG